MSMVTLMRGRRRNRLLIAAIVSWLALAGSDVVAQPPADQAEQQQNSGRTVNQRQALDIVRAQFPGEVISINEVRQGDRVRYRVRLDNEGNIYTVYVDKATGAISRE